MMRGLSVAILYLLTAVLLGSSLAVALQSFLAYPFDRILTRSVLLVLLILLIPLWRMVSKETSGLVFPDFSIRQFSQSFLVGLVILAIPVFMILILEIRLIALELEISFLTIVGILLVGIFLACLIGLFEEILFRGFLYGSLKKRIGGVMAALVSSALYSSVHFLKPTGDLELPINWFAGFVYLEQSIGNMIYLQQDWDARLSLMILGCFFCLIRERFNLFCCIGLHAAFVVGIAITRQLTTVNLDSQFLSLISSYNEIIGQLVSLWLLLLICLLYRSKRSEKSLLHPS
tara:strand:- start:136 stop:1002 length:867 start_codon:yes stop_codon:yes gene_type:complete